MNNNWSTAEEQRYQHQTDELIRRGCLGLALLALTLFPLFGFLDYYAHYEKLSELWTIRFSTTFFYFLVLLFLLKNKSSRYPFFLALFILIPAAVSITLMCLVLNGYESPYYAGVNLVILAAVLVLPVGAKRMAMVVSLVLAIYILGISIEAGFTIKRPEALVNNLYFMVATGVIGITAAFLTEKLRRESFDRYLQLEKKSELEKALGVATTSRDEAERALKLREDFISLASHELNTPLTALKIQTHLAQKKFKDSQVSIEAFNRLVNTYEGQLERLIRIVNDMLDISRIKSGKLALEPGEVDLEGLVREVVERTIHDEGIRVNIKSNGPIKGNWDTFRIEQVILNLLTNAIKYGNQKPLEIKISKEEAWAVVSIKDQGIGIAPEHLDKIFERFERAVLSHEFTGLGLGLYISRQIVLSHGGDISVQSQQGEGSIFSVKLPL